MSIEYLRAKLGSKQGRCQTRYRYYEMKNTVMDFGISTPPKLQGIQSKLGWCTKAVDSLADRLIFRTMKHDELGMMDLFNANNPDTFFSSAILSALITSCSFVYISKVSGEVRLQVIDGGNATGTIDPVSGMLKEGYAILDTNEYGVPTLEAYFAPNRTDFYQNGELLMAEPNYTGHPLLVPIINRPDDKRPFGHSVISRACMSLQDQACRTLKRSEIAAEFYSYPQKYAIGLSDEVEMPDKWAMTMATMMTIGKDSDGDKPNVGQFSQQSMSPHVEQLKMFASAFAGETGLTLDDLGFVTSNPSSADAIKSSHENLRLKARKAQRTFGTGFLNVGYTALCLRDDFSYNRAVVYQAEPVFEPIFEPDASMLSSIGDGAIKLNQAVEGYITKENLRDLTGIGE